eukprot:CCRYP_002656-RA/>CCRYP_002656-RA protein AED:0.01 eAED:0.01 QI:55/1/1/1/0.5/0.33/3/669/500
MQSIVTMARLDYNVLIFSSLFASQRRSLGFSPASFRTVIHPSYHPSHGALFQDQSPARDNDSSYEALRRKFGLLNDSTINLASTVDSEKQKESDSVAPVNTLSSLLQSGQIQPDADTTTSSSTFQVSTDNDDHDSIADSLQSEPTLVQLSASSPVDDPTPTDPHQQDTLTNLDSSFSRKFTRYSIPLTKYGGSITKSDLKKETEQRKQRRLDCGVIVKLKPTSQATQRNLFTGLFRRGIEISESILSTPSSASIKTLDTRIKNAYSGRPFRWVTSESKRKAEHINVLLLDEDFVAAAAFWRMAADISQHEMGISRGDDDDILEQNHKNLQWYLALPETTCTVAQHLCDIINWYADYLGTEREKHNDSEGTEQGDARNRENATVILRARLDTTHSNSIPIVEFTAEYLGQRSESNQITAPETKPTSEDTERRTKSWVQRLLVQLGVCPFTKSNVKSGQGLGDVGVPVANIMYRHSGASFEDHGTSGEVYTLMADTWEAIVT